MQQMETTVPNESSYRGELKQQQKQIMKIYHFSRRVTHHAFCVDKGLRNHWMWALFAAVLQESEAVINEAGVCRKATRIFACAQTSCIRTCRQCRGSAWARIKRASQLVSMESWKHSIFRGASWNHKKFLDAHWSFESTFLPIGRFPKTVRCHLPNWAMFCVYRENLFPLQNRNVV